MKALKSRPNSTSNDDQAPAPLEIPFYRANEKPYGGFSNLFRRPILFEGEEFATAEHAYQAGKARKKQVRDWILSAPTPGLVAMAAHGLYTWDIVPDWSRIKYDRMRAVLRAKFSQHEDLRELLLSTGKAHLVESATVDNAVNRTWGVVNGKGQNMLGVMLMDLREELKKDAIASLPKKAKTKRVKESAGRAGESASNGWNGADAISACR